MRPQLFQIRINQHQILRMLHPSQWLSDEAHQLMTKKKKSPNQTTNAKDKAERANVLNSRIFRIWVFQNFHI